MQTTLVQSLLGFHVDSFNAVLAESKILKKLAVSLGNMMVQICIDKKHDLTCLTYMSRDMRFPTMWFVRPAKAQTILRIRAD